MIYTKYLLVFFMIIFSASSFAEYTCKTISNGREYISTKKSKQIASKVALSKCKEIIGSNSQRCEMNLDCSPGHMYEPKFHCQSFSRGKAFTANRATASQALKYAKTLCKQPLSSAPGECDEFVHCKKIGADTNLYKCETESSGHVFKFTSWDKYMAKNYTAYICWQSRKTRVSECEENVECSLVHAKKKKIKKTEKIENTKELCSNEFASIQKNIDILLKKKNLTDKQKLLLKSMQEQFSRCKKDILKVSDLPRASKPKKTQVQTDEESTQSTNVKKE